MLQKRMKSENFTDSKHKRTKEKKFKNICTVYISYILLKRKTYSVKEKEKEKEEEREA